MRPAHNPRRVVTETKTFDTTWTARRKQLQDFCKEIEEKARLIPYSGVRNDISRKVGEQLTHPTRLATNRWMDVAADLGCTDQCVLAKLKYHEKWDVGQEAECAFSLFLTRIFAENGGTLWQLIEVLSKECYTDVMEVIQPDIREFVSNYVPATEIQRTAACSMPQYSLDSGHGQSINSNGSPSYQSRVVDNVVNHVQIPSANHNLLINPKIDRFNMSNFLENINDGNESHQESKFQPKPEPFPKGINPFDTEDGNIEFDIPFGGKSLSDIKVFIPHTQEEEDEKIAEEIAKRLADEYHFKTYLLKNMSSAADLDIGSFVLQIMENMDFLVPVLSRSYLQEIVPVGDPNEMPNERLVLRYLHAVSQTRVINKNSLNYLIRPIMVDGVNYGMVRRWHEFQSAVKYPKDLGRLARNLAETKKILVNGKYGRG